MTNALARFVSEICQVQAGADSPWWFEDVLRNSLAHQPTALTGERIGILLAISPTAPDDIRATAQPQASTDTLRQILLRCDPGAEGSAALLEKLLHSDNGRDGYLGIGASLTRRSAPPRLYYGCAERPGALVTRLARLGMWPARLSRDAEHILSFLKSTGTVIGTARGLSPDGGYSIYFDAGRSSPRALLAGVEIRLGTTVTAATTKWMEAIAAAPDLTGKWGLTVSLDAAGEIDDLKAEFSLDRGPAPEALISEVLRTQAYTRAASAAAAAGLALQCQTVSCSDWNGLQRSSAYFALIAPEDRSTNTAASMHVTRMEPVRMKGRLRRACLLTLTALHRAQGAAGSWQDFDLPGVGVSDHWVTAHVAARLNAIGATFDSKTHIARAAQFLARAWNEGLGYNVRSPVDADSTAHWLLLFALVRPELAERNAKCLLRFQRDDGSFGTFRDATETSSWTLGHPEVTAVAIQALAPWMDRTENRVAIERAFAWAAAHGWATMRASFWWNLRWAGRVNWIIASRSAGRDPPPELLEAPSERLTSSSLDTGYFLHWALLTGRMSEARLAANALLETQLANGLWPTVPVLKVMPDSIEAAGGGVNPSMIFADRGYYSAALILSALCSWGRAVGEFA